MFTIDILSLLSSVESAEDDTLTGDIVFLSKLIMIRLIG